MSIIKYNEHFSINLSIEENPEIEELDYIVAEVIMRDDEDDERNVATILIKKITAAANQFIDIADSDSGDFYSAMRAVIKEENKELITGTLKIEYTQFLNQVFYIDQVKLHEDNIDIIAPALASTMRQLTKAADPQDWCSIMYKNKTFEKNGVYLEDKEVTQILKALEFRKIPKVATNISDNTIFLTGGELFDCKIKYDNKAPKLK